MADRKKASGSELGRKLLDVLVIVFAIAGWVFFLRWIRETVEWSFMGPIAWYFELDDVVFIETLWTYILVFALIAFTLYLIGRLLYSTYELIIIALRYWK